MYEYTIHYMCSVLRHYTLRCMCVCTRVCPSLPPFDLSPFLQTSHPPLPSNPPPSPHYLSLCELRSETPAETHLQEVQADPSPGVAVLKAGALPLAHRPRRHARHRSLGRAEALFLIRYIF